MQHGQCKFSDNGDDRNLYCNMVVILGGIPVAGFLSPIDVEAYLGTLNDFDLDNSRVISQHLERDCLGESISGRNFLSDRKSNLESAKAWVK